MSLVWMSATNPERAASLSILDEETGLYPEGVFVVTSWSEETLAKKIAAVDRKLARYGKAPVEPISFDRRMYEKTEIDLDSEAETKVSRVVAKLPYIKALVYIQSAVIQIGDRQQIMGMIERVGDSEDMVITPWNTASDDVDAVTRLSDAVGRELRCDHCHATRRRNAAWILKNTDGSLFMVAKSCAKAYFGQNVAGLLNDLIDLDEVGSDRSPRPFDRVEAVAITLGVILRHGFVSNAALGQLNPARRDAGLPEIKSTSDLVGEYVQALRALQSGIKKGGDQWAEENAHQLGHAAQTMAEDYLELAVSVIEDFTRLEIPNGFQANVQALLRSMAYAKDWWNHQAQVVAGLAGYLKDQGHELPNVWAFKVLTQKPEEVAFAAGFLAASGTKVDLKVTVESVRFFDNSFGGKYLVIMRNQTNHRIVYSGTASVTGPQGKLSVGDLEPGDVLEGTATVSEQQVYNGRRGDVTSTVIQRPKLTLVAGRDIIAQ